MSNVNTLPLGFIGAGNMAGAIIGGIVRGGRLAAEQIAVTDISPEKREHYRDAGHPVFNGATALTEACRTIVLAVKPQTFSAVLPEVAKGMAREKLLVSIAAGISAQAIKEAVGFDCKLVLAMPNTPLLLGCGATALSRVAPATQSEFEQVCELFACAGIAEEIGADKMNEVIPVNGSSPAFLYLFARAVTDWAEQAGIPKETALRLFCQTMQGAAKMLLETGRSPQELIDMVCSPGGTTLAAMGTLENNGFAMAVEQACEACVRRAEELARENG